MNTNDVLIAENIREEQEIGAAFALLLESLPQEGKSLDRAFAKCKKLGWRSQRHALDHASSRACMPHCEPLISVGLTPLGVFYALKNTLGMANRLASHGYIPRTERVLITARSSADFMVRSQVHLAGTALVPSESLVHEILQVSRCEEAVAQALWSWLVSTSYVRPYLFPGAKATKIGTVEDNLVSLEILEKGKQDLATIWTATA